MNSDLYQALAEILFRTSLAIAVAAVVVLLLLKLLRLNSPALHRAAWLVVLIQGLIVARFAWEIPWYEPQQAGAQVSDATAPLDDLAGAISAESTTTNVDTSEPGKDLTSSSVTSTVDGAAALPASTQTQTQLTNPAVTWPAPSTLVAVWLIGIGILIAVHIGSYAALWRTLRRATPAKRQWSRQWHRILNQACIDAERNVPMLVHPSLGPLICLSPAGYRIVVPEELWEELNERQRAAVLNHELAHYVRGDVWKSLVVRLLALPHWFNPLAWLAVQKFDECGEWACDQYLIKRDPQGGPDFANALLQIMQFPQPALIGVRGAGGGSSLRERVKRLCRQERRREDSLVKRSISMFILLLVFAVGLAEVRLVARAIAQEESSPSMTQEEESSDQSLSDPERMKQFASRLASDEDPLLKSLQEVLDTPAGQTVLSERATGKASEARQAARQNALPGFLEERFDTSGDQLVLKADQQEFRQNVMAQTAVYQSDVKEIQTAIDDIAERLQSEDESEKLLLRLLENPMTAWVLYATEIRNRIRPDERTILEQYRTVFVVGPNGKFVIRPGVRDAIEEQLKLGHIRRNALKRIKDELKTMSEEVADVDEQHQKLKEMLADDYFAAFCCYQTVGQSVERVDESLQNLFRYFDQLLEDHSDGLHIAAEAESQVGELLVNFKSRRQAAELLQEPIERFAGRIDADRDDLHLRVQQAFENPTLVQAMLTRDAETRYVKGGDYVRQMIGGQLTESDDGKLNVREDRRQQVTDYARRLLQYSRSLRRQLAAADDRTAMIQDETLRDALQSMAGKYLMRRAVNQQLAARQFDGLAMWIEENFQESGAGFVLNTESKPELESFLEQVKQVQAQLANDDF